MTEVISSTHSGSNGAIGVQVEGVNKFFGENKVLEEVSIKIPPGSFHVLVGPSGCGKTTLLRMIGGLERPTSGAILFGEPSSNPSMETTLSSGSQMPKELSYGFQEPRLLPWLTVSDNVALPLELAGVSPSVIQPKVDDVLAKVSLSHAAGLYPRQLSGGMKMRATIARSLVTEPKLLLLDEPFGALDEITKNRLDDELLELWKQYKMTVVLVTHSLSEAVYLAQSIHVLAPNPGRVLETLEVSFEERMPELRLTTPFTETVAKAHQVLLRAEENTV